MRRVVSSARAELRLREAAAWLAARGAGEPLLILGATSRSASEIARTGVVERGAGFGWHRMTLGRLAADLAKRDLATLGLTPANTLAIEALCVRVLHRLRAADQLGRFEPIVDQPGLPRALARTLAELRLAGAAAVEGAGAGAELDAALAAFVDELERARLADRARVFEVATAATGSALLGLPLLLLDVAVRTRVEQRLVQAIVARAPDVLATIAVGDKATTAWLAPLIGEPEAITVEERDSLARVQKHLFDRGRLNFADLDPSIEIFSAPGENRECVEVARRVVAAAEQGMPFDRMAIVLRSPNHYRAHLEEAFDRAGVPVFFDQGTVRPDPSGRAFLALLACAAEGLSARRFAEYVSIGEVPQAVDGVPPPALPAAERWVAPDQELSPSALVDPWQDDVPHAATTSDGPVAGGTLRAPWRWERLLVEAAVIGGRDRWERRLAGLAARLALDDSESGREGRARAIEDLAHLRTFALPLLDELAALPERATWGAWLDRLGGLATRALKEPARVLAVFAELAPMAEVGPVTLREIQIVLAPRLAELVERPEPRRYGRLLVAPIEAIRGMSLDLVFVPGLAERMFPHKVIDDPLLLDHVRAALGLELMTRAGRVDDERLALRLAIGAASKRAVLSYPRIDLDQGRPRVPSFYGLEVLEAAEGQLPGFDELGKKADVTGAARIGWPAPAESELAIDEAEHDLALLDGLLRPHVDAPTGTAAYLLAANPHLGRTLRFRARRWTIQSWKPADGLVTGGDAGRAALAAHALDRRSFSPTALEQLAHCPYRFALRTILKLEPREQPEPIEALGPLERGSLFHDVMFELMSELRDAGELPITNFEAIRERIDRVLARVAARYRDDLCPAIDRVWDDGIEAIGADVREHVRRSLDDRAWIPRRFELAFGLTGRDAADPASVDEPVELPIGISLRGSIDLVEESVDGVLRATDYKTGAARAKPNTVIGNGTALQPVLYALVLERLFAGAKVGSGRLSYCTSKGEFRVVDVALDQAARDAAALLSATLGEHFARGLFPAAPAKGACQYCDFRLICGPYEEHRVRTKLKHEPLVQLQKLRDHR